MNDSLRRVWGLIYRHLALYRRSWPRVVELIYWPVLQMLIWGFTTSFIAGRGGSAMVVAGALLGGVLLWEVALRSQMGVAISFLEELWSRNLGHLFVSPIRPWEMVAALLSVSVLRMLTGVLPAVGLAFVLYAFNLFALGPVVVLFFANLMVMGWWVALGVVSLILRHGAGAEAMAWSLLFGLTPFSAVFYPVSVLPAAMRPVAFVLPSSHVFEGMRAALDGVVLWGELGWAVAFNLLWLGVLTLVFAAQFRQARVRGAPTEYRGMMETRFWLIRHAIVAENERARLYGIKDVPLCPESLVAQVPMYQALARVLPVPAVWGCTPLSRTRKTAEAIFAAGYPAQELMVVPGLIEQNLGELQGLDRGMVSGRLTLPAHPFWPLAPDEVPPGGESVAELLERVGAAMEGLAEAHAGQDVVIVSHGGAIRAAIGHAMGVDARAILHLSVQNISLTRLDRLQEGWRVDAVNQLIA